MEPAKIDWKNIDSVFVEDELYEHISAPKWVDFLLPDHPVDDEAWFCRPDCKHPKTAEDFLRATPPKVLSPAGFSPPVKMRDQSRRDARPKRRALATSNSSSVSKFDEDSENQDPNLTTPMIHRPKTVKATFKSSSEKTTDGRSQTEDMSRLKTTLSARNLFAGRDILLTHITELCNELKRLATRAKERVEGEKPNVSLKKEESKDESHQVLGERKERQPLLEVDKENSVAIQENSVAIQKSGAKEKTRLKRRVENAENVPVSLKLENIKSNGDKSLTQIRTCPPTPQCFSATKGSTPSKALRPRPVADQERAILQEVEHNKEIAENPMEKGKSASIIDVREAKALDVFWFLKPCTLSS